ncbi:potassium channel family protein [Pseudomonas sp. LS1212]|uniref:potassium channel family protein n=1 Tax=Pseudomonas sp. LS1212 TaxID=2972478 RepID=UPI00215C930A|nr:potassium channel family protein [Pseudomonas sp. LS1212]UVJ41765.1 potassium channel family protein [Pseudomonas sp. LS1212]
MLLILLTGFPVIVLCLLLQAIFLAICLRHYVHITHARRGSESQVQEIGLLATVMLVMLLGNLVQMAIWALLFVLLGEFDDFATALYFSGVTFATLGYGDMVMSPRWRLLGPLEAANGILMFGVTTSVMTAAVMDLIKNHLTRLRQRSRS